MELEESGEEGQVHVRGVDDPAFLKLDQSQMPLQVRHIIGIHTYKQVARAFVDPTQAGTCRDSQMECDMHEGRPGARRRD